MESNAVPSTDALVHELAQAPTPDEASRSAAQSRVDDILRPAGALARLDEIAVWLAGWQRSANPTVTNPAALIFAADHGVTAEGVSAYPAEVTGAMLAAFNASKASVSALASVAGASVRAIDVGVGDPTNNLRVEAAMSPDRFTSSFDAGRTAVAELDTDLLIIGEMGIGNTTSATKPKAQCTSDKLMTANTANTTVATANASGRSTMPATTRSLSA